MYQRIGSLDQFFSFCNTKKHMIMYGCKCHPSFNHSWFLFYLHVYLCYWFSSFHIFWKIFERRFNFICTKKNHIMWRNTLAPLLTYRTRYLVHCVLFSGLYLIFLWHKHFYFDYLAIHYMQYYTCICFVARTNIFLTIQFTNLQIYSYSI